jgi:glutathione S-transferase
MKSLIPLLVLCAVLFVASDAAPVLPSGFKLKAASAEEQQLDEWANTFLSRVFTPASTRDGTAAAAARDRIKTLFGALPTKSTDNGETYVQSDSGKKLLQTFLKAIPVSFFHL